MCAADYRRDGRSSQYGLPGHGGDSEHVCGNYAECNIHSPVHGADGNLLRSLETEEKGGGPLGHSGHNHHSSAGGGVPVLRVHAAGEQRGRYEGVH